MEYNKKMHTPLHYSKLYSSARKPIPPEYSEEEENGE